MISGRVRKHSPRGCGWLPRRLFGLRVGGHLYGRFCRIPSPPARRTHRDSRSPEICTGSFAANVRRSLNAPQRPSQPPQRDDLLFLFFAQDIAHVTERNLPASSMSRFSYLVGRFSGVHGWPVLGVPRGHQLHETLEITHGFSDWFELGFYVFTSADSRVGWQWVGDHIRPRVAVPESWKWPVGVSLSTEIGYQRAVYSPDTWTIEIRPIVDKTIGRLYLCFNPTIDRSFHGPSVPQGVTFSPNVKVGYDVTKVVNAGFEYYGALGPITGFDPLQQQQQQIFAVTDLNFSPKWEFNFGVGVGLTGGTDHLLVKMIIGRRVTTK